MLFLVRIIFDIISILISCLSIKLEIYSQPILEDLFSLFTLVYIIFLYQKRYRTIKFSKKQKQMVVVIIIIIMLIIIAHSYQHIKLFSEMDLIINKYINYNFKLLSKRVCFLSVFLQSLSNISIFIISFICIIIGFTKNVKKYKSNQITIMIIRIFGYICCYMIVIAFFFIVFSSNHITHLEFKSLDVIEN